MAQELQEVPDRIVQNRTDRIMRRKGYLSGVKEWYASLNQTAEGESAANEEKTHGLQSERSHARPRCLGRGDSMYSFNSLGSDMDSDETPDQRKEATTGENAEDLDDLEKNTLRQLDYKTRRKHMMRIKIEYNVSCKC
jgi:hypothetical protein